ncbi:MAG: beta-ketoacyl-[acyl-carrier-protein] synthase family protein [Gemmatimonadota bacterium]
MSRRVVVTGIGPITASGIGRAGLEEGLRGGRSPVDRISRFDPSPFRSHIAAEVPDFEPTHHMDAARAKRLDRFGQFSIASARLALEDAALDETRLDGDRVAVQMGSALGGVSHAEAELQNYLTRGVRGVDPRLALTVFGGAASCNVAIEFGFRGPNSTNAMSCASGTIAVGEAWRLIRDGSADVALAGGIEAPLSPLSYGAFAIIRAMSTRNDDPARACRPFDAARDGFVMGEGACTLVLETLEHATARGARIHAEILGYANSNDAHHMTAPLPDGSQAARAMRMALERADVRPEQIDYVNAHASSTPLNDSTESLALRTVFGERADVLPVSGTKPFYGHALGASGAIETGICCMALQSGWMPPTLNLEEPGDGCDLNYVSGAGRTAELRHVLTNSFGFGGINACLVLGRAAENGAA